MTAAEHVFTAGFLFCGIGAGAMGFLDARATHGAHTARFVCVGGIDNDPLACADFEYLTGSPSLCADLSTMQPAALRKAWGDRAPDCLFLSPPCKAFSGLLSAKLAATAKYQEMANLAVRGIFLACETWATPPALLVMENVPRIQTRGRQLLDQCRKMLRHYGYVLHESTHDCGEMGGLAQHRRRYLLVARRPKAVSQFVYQPPKLRVRGCGEALGTLPLPADPSAGPLHRLPRLSPLNWLRLSLIPAGGDWRDLPRGGDVSLKQTAAGAGSFAGRPGLMRVQPWDAPSPTITGSASVSSSNATAAVADPRVSPASGWFNGVLGVHPWSAPAGTVCGGSLPMNGAFSVADPRISLPETKGRHQNKFAVSHWGHPANTVTGARPVTSGGPSVADPRVGGTSLDAAPDTRLGCEPRSGAYEVLAWDTPAKTITGSLAIDNGPSAVADPRPTPEFLQDVPIYVAADGTWHRPMTTLELAVLQGLPARVNGAPLALAGKSSARWREAIGNAVPVGSAAAIGSVMLRSLLLSSLGVFALGAEPVWVAPSHAPVPPL